MILGKKMVSPAVSWSVQWMSQSSSFLSASITLSFLVPAGKTGRKIKQTWFNPLGSHSTDPKTENLPPRSWRTENQSFTLEVPRYRSSTLCKSTFYYANMSGRKEQVSMESGKSAGLPNVMGNPSSTSYCKGWCAGANFCQQKNVNIES